MTALAEMEDTIRRRLSLFDYPLRDWMLIDAATGYDVVILGAGKRALALALALQRERIHRVAVIDTQQPDTLCMAAEISGGETAARADFATHDLSLPLLSFRSWWQASGGDPAALPEAAALADHWAAYLRWYRRFLAADLLTDIADIAVPGAPTTHLAATGARLTARRLVITTDADAAHPARWAARASDIDAPGAVHGFAALDPARRQAAVAALRAMPGSPAPAEDRATTRFFELLDERGHAVPVHLFGTKALASVGPAALAAHLVRYGVPRMLAGLSRLLFLEDQDALFEAFQRFETAEILGGKLATQ